MLSSISHLIASANTDVLRLIRAAKNLTQADIVARAQGTMREDQTSLIKRGKWFNHAHAVHG